MKALQLYIEILEAAEMTTRLCERLVREGLDDVVRIQPKITGVFVTTAPGVNSAWEDALIFIPWSEVDGFDFNAMMPDLVGIFESID